jgi:hypothetical protein
MLPIEWTNQHGCGANSKTNCEIVIQYMCEDTADPQVDDWWPYTETKNANTNVGQQAFRAGANTAAPRDGIPDDANDDATDTIPDNADDAVPDNEDTRRYGMHESYDTYQLCQRTERNEGLYTADQRIRRNDARATRQNPNGDRRGLECPEERDYYPYWRPSSWVDEAILTNDGGDEPCGGSANADDDDPMDCATERCRYYLANSQNVQGRKGFCDVPIGGDVDDKINSNAWQNNQWYNNQDACEANGFDWRDLALSDVMDAKYPVCAKTQFARVNQVRSRRAIPRARSNRARRSRSKRASSQHLSRARRTARDDAVATAVPRVLRSHRDVLCTTRGVCARARARHSVRGFVVAVVERSRAGVCPTVARSSRATACD